MKIEDIYNKKVYQLTIEEIVELFKALDLGTFVADPKWIIESKSCCGVELEWELWSTPQGMFKSRCPKCATHHWRKGEIQ